MGKSSELPTVTGEQVCAAVAAAGIEFIEHHDCSICGVKVGYRVIEGLPYFDSACGCTSWYSEPSLREWDTVAWWINTQESRAARVELLRRVGITDSGSSNA